MSGIQYLAGIKTNDRVVLACDKTIFAYGALAISSEHDKTRSLGDKKVMMCIGEDGDVEQFADYTQKNLELYRLRNGYEMGPRASAYWIRKFISDNLRTQDAYMVETVVGGYDDTDKLPYLAVIDYLGNRLDNTPYVFRGFGGNLSLSIMDSVYRRDMSEEETIDAMKMCLKEVRKRFLANLPGFQVLVIDANGVRKMPDINL